MRNSQMRRWFAAGITGTLFVVLMLALAVPVAADGNGLVTQPAGQGGNSIVYVTSPGFANNGTAVNPINNGVNNGINGCIDASCGGNVVCTANACFPAGTICTINGCGIPNNGGFCDPNFGCGVPINFGGCAINGGCFGQFFGNVAQGGTLGYTAAGPIVGIDQNGNPIVYDVRGGSLDTYTRAANGQVCEADSRGNCQKGTPGNP